MSTPTPRGGAPLPTTTAPHPGITIRIRYVDQRGRETARFAPIRLGPDTHAIATMEWPPCQCQRCGGRS